MGQATFDSRSGGVARAAQSRVARAVRRAPRILGWTAAALALGLAAAWAFLAYRNPGMVFDFALLLQMCGIPVAR